MSGDPEFAVERRVGGVLIDSEVACDGDDLRDVVLGWVPGHFTLQDEQTLERLSDGACEEATFQTGDDEGATLLVWRLRDPQRVRDQLDLVLADYPPFAELGDLVIDSAAAEVTGQLARGEIADNGANVWVYSAILARLLRAYESGERR